MKKFFLLVAGIALLATGYRLALRERAPSADEMAAEAVGKMIATGTYDPSVLANIQQKAQEQATAGEKPQGRVDKALDWIENLFHRKPKTTTRDPVLGAQARVELLLAYWKEDSIPAAACMWARGIPYLPNADEVHEAEAGFEGWRRDMNLDHEIQGFQLGETRRQKDATIVEVRINRGSYHIGVPDAAGPVFWTE